MKFAMAYQMKKSQTCVRKTQLKLCQLVLPRLILDEKDEMCGSEPLDSCANQK
jgi:hypothetical protein